MHPLLTVLAGAAGLLAIVAIAGTGFVLGMRAKSPLVQGPIIWLSKRLLNRLQLRTAGRPGAFAGIIRVPGRLSGRIIETPVSPVRTPEGYAIALPYGLRSQWLRNVLAAGAATVTAEGETWRVDQPALVPMADVEACFSPGDVATHRRMAVTDALVLRRVEQLAA